MSCYCETSDEFEILDDVESDSIPDYSLAMRLLNDLDVR